MYARNTEDNSHNWSTDACVIPYPAPKAEGMLGWMFAPLLFLESPITVKSFLTCYCERGPSRATHSPLNLLSIDVPDQQQ